MTLSTAIGESDIPASSLVIAAWAIALAGFAVARISWQGRRERLRLPPTAGAGPGASREGDDGWSPDVEPDVGPIAFLVAWAGR